MLERLTTFAALETDLKQARNAIDAVICALMYSHTAPGEQLARTAREHVTIALRRIVTDGAELRRLEQQNASLKGEMARLVLSTEAAHG